MRERASKIGRPGIGRPVQCRYPAGLLDEIDAAAAAIGVGRPEWLRRAAQAALDAGRVIPLIPALAAILAEEQRRSGEVTSGGGRND